MGKKIAIVVVALLLLLLGVQMVIKMMVGSTYRSLAFQKNVSTGIEYALQTLGVPAEVRLSGVDADGWDCTIRAVKITTKTKSAEVFEISQVRLSPEVWGGLFGDEVVAKLTGLLDGQKGTTDIIVRPGLLDMAGGQKPLLSSVSGEVSGLGPRWVSDFLFASQPSNPRMKFKDGTMSVKGQMSDKTGSLTIEIGKPTWEIRLRQRREIIGEDFQVALQLGTKQLRLTKPAVIRAKPGSISVTGGVGTGGEAPSLNLQVETQGNRIVTMMASQLFRCGRPMPPRFSVRGKPPGLKCQ